jgi:hypothetical protein
MELFFALFSILTAVMKLLFGHVPKPHLPFCVLADVYRMWNGFAGLLL